MTTWMINCWPAAEGVHEKSATISFFTAAAQNVRRVVVGYASRHAKNSRCNRLCRELIMNILACMVQVEAGD